MPSSRALAEDLGFARATVVEVYAQLQAEGYLVSRPGSGTWVAKLQLPSTPSVPKAEQRRMPRFDFDPGLPDLTAFPRAAWARALRRGIRDAPAATLGFGDARGRDELRELLATYLTRARGVVADPSLIAVCAGTNHALALIGKALMRRGVSRIAMEDPCLSLHRSVLANVGLDVVPLPVDDHGACTHLLDGLEVGAVVLAPAHQFPMGVQLRPERRTAAIDWARRSNALVIEDDYDAELRYDRAPIGTLQALDPDRVAYVGTVSKTLSPGLRLGWMVLPPSLLREVGDLRKLEDMHNPVTEQIAFCELMRSGDYERHLRRMRSRYRTRRDRLLTVLASLTPLLRPLGISAGLRILLELPAGARSSIDIARSALDESLSLFSVVNCYHGARLPQGTPDGFVIGYAALAEHDFDSAIDTLAEFLAEAVPRSPHPGLRARGPRVIGEARRLAAAD